VRATRIPLPGVRVEEVILDRTTVYSIEFVCHGTDGLILCVSPLMGQRQWWREHCSLSERPRCSLSLDMGSTLVLRVYLAGCEFESRPAPQESEKSTSGKANK
jgi:hypothetical protein